MDEIARPRWRMLGLLGVVGAVAVVIVYATLPDEPQPAPAAAPRRSYPRPPPPSIEELRERIADLIEQPGTRVGWLSDDRDAVLITSEHCANLKAVVEDNDTLRVPEDCRVVCRLPSGRIAWTLRDQPPDLPRQPDAAREHLPP